MSRRPLLILQSRSHSLKVYKRPRSSSKTLVALRAVSCCIFLNDTYTYTFIGNEDIDAVVTCLDTDMSHSARLHIGHDSGSTSGNR
jgi:hypothetical protein